MKSRRKRIKSVAILLTLTLLMGGLSLYASAPAQVEAANGSFNTGLYFIRNVFSGKYLDVCQNGLTNRTKLQQYEYCAEPSQQWYIQLYSGDYYTLSANHSRDSDAYDNTMYMDSTITIESGTQLQIYQRDPPHGESVHRAAISV